MSLVKTQLASNSSLLLKLLFSLHTASFNASCFSMTNIDNILITSSNPLYFIQVFPQSEGDVSIQLKPGLVLISIINIRLCSNSVG